MFDSRIDAIAQVLVHYSLAVQAGELIVIRGSVAARPLLTALYRQVLRAGGRPELLVYLPELEPIRFGEAGDEQLAALPPHYAALLDRADGMIFVAGETNTRALVGVDPGKRRLAAQSMMPLLKQIRQRSMAGKFRRVSTLFPTQAYAQDAEMSLAEYEDFVFGACIPDEEDPIGHWQRLSQRQAGLIAGLQGTRELHVVAPGTDLRLGVAGRTFVNCDGHSNFPDGEIFTGPEEHTVSGFVSFNFPVNYRGIRVRDVRLWFEEGCVVKAVAAEGQEFLEAMLDTDEGARRVGEFAVGTNPGINRFTGHTLFDEKIHGTVHMALGSSYPQTGGVNESAIHWDMVCDMRSESAIHADGRLIYRNGDFVPEFLARAANHGGDGHA